MPQSDYIRCNQENADAFREATGISSS